MNRQCLNLFAIDQDDARGILVSVFDTDQYYPLSYYAFPYTFGNTKGPMSRSNNSISGQAMTTFTIEAWTDGRHSVLFCQGLVIDIRCDVDGFDPMKVRF